MTELNSQPSGVVVGIDGSPGSRVALEWALTTDPSYGPVTPVAAWHVPWWAATLAGAAVPVRYLQMEQDIDAMIDDVVSDVSTARLADRVVAHGGAPSVLLEAAADKALLVVGTRGHGAFLDTMLGSVAIACSLRTTVPMIIVADPPWNPDGPCVVGVDGSPNAFAALIWTMQHAPEGAEVVAVNTWNPIIASGIDLPESLHVQLEERSRRLLESEVARACEVVPHAPVPKTLSACGDARSVLESNAANANMLVLGARGDGGVTSVVLGSVATALIHRPVCPTVIVPLVARHADSADA